MKRWYLIAYDIREPRRLKRLHYRLKKRALPIQYSVFSIRTTERELRALEAVIKSICEAEDDVRIYATGSPQHYWTSERQALQIAGLYSEPTQSTPASRKDTPAPRWLSRLFGGHS